MDSQQLAIAVHHDPVWKDRADFLILVELEPWELPGRYEQLWARKVSDCSVELCCIPFFSYGIRLGDVVQFRVDPNGRRLFEKVLVSSGRTNIRIVVESQCDADELMSQICVALEDARCRYEVFQTGYISADVPSESAERYLLRELSPLVGSGGVVIEKI